MMIEIKIRIILKEKENNKVDMDMGLMKIQDNKMAVVITVEEMTKAPKFIGHMDMEISCQ